jgi:hypothetical protein
VLLLIAVASFIEVSKRKTPQLAGQQIDWNSQPMNLL